MTQTHDFGQVKKPLRQRLFDLMADLQWHTWEELKEYGGPRFGARLLELKRLGYDIQTQFLEDGSTGKKYRLLSLVRGEPQEKKVKAFLSPSDVEALVNAGTVSEGLLSQIKAAYLSYQKRAEML